MFNQKVRETGPGAKGKLGGVVKAGLLVEVDGKFVTVSNKFLGRITVCVPREIPVAAGERLHLKANRKLSSGARVTNGEVITIKSVRKDAALELADGRVLDASFREFLPVTQSHPTARRAEQWITSCFLIQLSRRRPTPSNGL
ncbi:MAG: hypothetical protein L0Z50_42820 [Verrucomicrobiales bacterium]|nr:hypothetical protein [Verrucomicrobiales bacterium]